MGQNVSLCDRSDIVMFLILKVMSSTFIMNDRTHKPVREAVAGSSWVGCSVLLTFFSWIFSISVYNSAANEDFTDGYSGSWNQA